MPELLAAFKIGDVVRLRTAVGQYNPPMTVEELDPGAAAAGECGPMVGCVWFDAQHRLNRANFTPELLEVFDPSGRSTR